MRTTMAMSVATTAMTRQIFPKRSEFHQVDILGYRFAMSLKGPDAGQIQFMQRPTADTTDDNGIDLMPAKPCNRIAGTMLMNLVAVGY